MTDFNCCFCNHRDLTLLYTGQFHPVKKDHGPFNFYICNICHSGLTWPLPSPDQLQTLYSSFAAGMDGATRNNRDSHPLNAWYQQCIDRGLKQLPHDPNRHHNFTWIDIGAGKGEMAKLLAEQFPNSKGLAIDFHTRPQTLDNFPNLDWLQCDLNDPAFYHKFHTRKFDLVLSITVLEHVREPLVLLKNMIRLLNKNGALYLTVPDYSSRAARVLKTNWPYYIPGEHLNLPSKKGLNLALSQLLEEPVLSNESFEVYLDRIILPYPLAYYLEYFGLNYLAKSLAGSNRVIRLPTGILEAGLRPVQSPHQ